MGGLQPLGRAFCKSALCRTGGLRLASSLHSIYTEDSKRSLNYVMAQTCDICGKGPQFGNNISHAHNVTRRRWNVNLQAVKALVNGAPKRLRVCTSCIKAGKIAKA
jgi:large subunit ribosomal protein L28